MDESPKPISVFLLDDHEIVRRGVRELIEAEPGLTVVGEASTAAEAMQRIPAVRPDVAVLDVRLPDGSGVEVCREVRSQLPGLACLMLTSFSDDDALFEAIMAGASGYVLKQIRGNDLVTAIRRVARGESLLDPTVTSKVLHRLRHPSGGGRAPRQAHPAGAQDPRPHRRGRHQPPDRHRAAPGREDREELRLEHADEAGHEPSHRGRRVRGEGRRRPHQLTPRRLKFGPPRHEN